MDTLKSIFEYVKKLINTLRESIKQVVDKIVFWRQQETTNKMYDNSGEVVVESVTTMKEGTKDWDEFLTGNYDEGLNDRTLNPEDDDANNDKRNKAYIINDGNTIMVMINKFVEEIPIFEKVNVNKIEWQSVVTKDDNKYIITRVDNILGGIETYLSSYVNTLTLNEMQFVHSLNNYVYINKKPVRDVDIYKSEYTNKNAVVFIKNERETFDYMITTKVYTEAAIHKYYKNRITKQTVCVVVIIPYNEGSIYHGCIIKVGKLPFIIFNVFKHVVPQYVICSAVSISMFSKEIKINYIGCD